jgi:hypothetical protein
VLTEPDGTSYYFGVDELPGWATGDASTGSAENVQVYGVQSTDPCYSATWTSSVCDQTWQWNLAYVTDAHGNAMSYFYTGPSATIPEGGDIYSDPLTLPAAVAELLSHAFASGAQAWETAPGFGNAGRRLPLASPVHVSGLEGLLRHVFPLGFPGAQNAPRSGCDSVKTRALKTPAMQVPNRLLADDDSMGGVSLLARLDRDVLSEPDVGAVVIDEGPQDVLGGASSADVENAYASLVTELSAQPGFGIPVILADLTPCGGNSQCTSAAEAVRLRRAAAAGLPGDVGEAALCRNLGELPARQKEACCSNSRRNMSNEPSENFRNP